MEDKKIIIAIDGHSSCGKSTMARELAKALSYIYIDTGAMYRTVTLYSMQEDCWLDEHTPDVEKLRRKMPQMQIDFRINPESGLQESFLDGRNVEKEIRSMEVSPKVSYISEIDFVRNLLTLLQQKMGKNGGVVMDGRDIGTTVFPNAQLKIFLTAREDVRAKRRLLELEAKGEHLSLDMVLENIRQRDRIDSSRAISPLRQAQDAIVLDNSFLTKEQQNNWLLEKAKNVINSIK